jgi:hypothetical protein
LKALDTVSDTINTAGGIPTKHPPLPRRRALPLSDLEVHRIHRERIHPNQEITATGLR